MVLDGYIRVSQVGGRHGARFISPSVQREEIEAWTSSHHAVLGEVFEELDESGGRADRPLLMRAIERVESGESGGVIVAKLDRFGRSVVDGLQSIARIEGAGGTFVSVQDGFDLSTPTGKLVLRILFSVGEWEFERVRNNWDAAQGRAIARGAYIGPRVPAGFVKGKDGRLRIVPEQAAVIKEAFERRRRGETYDTIAEFLNGSELETASGVRFSRGQVQEMLKSAAYRGEVHRGNHRNPSAHEPIVDAATWQACQALPRGTRDWGQGLVTGRIRCAACGRSMRVARKQGGSQFNYYNCWGHGTSCPEPAHVRADQIDALVEELIFRQADRVPRIQSNSGVEKCEEAVAKAEEALVAYRDNPRLLRTLGPDSFEAGVATRQRTVERALLELAQARRAVQGPHFDPGELEARWSGLDWSGRCAAVGEFLDCVVIARGASPVAERAWVFPPGRGPLAIDDGKLVESFEPSLQKAKRLRGLRPWPKRRIESELRAFLGGRSEWPEYGEFADRGLTRLFAQVMAWGGPHYWGAKLGVEVRRGTVIWSEALIHDALAPLLGGRTKWPSRAEFEAKGMMAVFSALKSHGGVAYWARQFGVVCQAPKRRRWSEEEIERELREFAGGRDRFPSYSEFQEAGLMKLYSAASRYGGTAYWAQRLGLEPAEGRLRRRWEREEAMVERGGETPD